MIKPSNNNTSTKSSVKIPADADKKLQELRGMLNEETIRKNFIMIYEILDEIVDFGLILDRNNDDILPLIYSNPETIISA